MFSYFIFKSAICLVYFVYSYCIPRPNRNIRGRLQKMDEDEVMHLFNSMDTTNDGSLDKNEFKRLTQKLGLPFDDYEIGITNSVV